MNTKRKPATLQEITIMRTMRAQGASYRAIGERIGRGTMWVHRYLVEPRKPTVEDRAAEIARARARRAEGMSLQMIADKFGVTAPTIQRWCHGILQDDTPKRREHHERIARARARRAEGATIYQIAEEFGVSTTTAHRWYGGGRASLKMQTA